MATTENFERDTVQSALARLGLTSEILQKVRERALDAALSCNELDAPTFAGTTLWDKGVRFFAEETIPFGWNRGNEANQPLVFNKDKTIAVTVASGDRHTGDPDHQPLTRAKKGVNTWRACHDNRQGSIGDWLDPKPAVASTKVPGRATWFLLMHRDKKANVLRSELSLPSDMDHKGRVNIWLKRILLADISFDAVAITTGENENGGNSETPEISVEITRLG